MIPLLVIMNNTAIINIINIPVYDLMDIYLNVLKCMYLRMKLLNHMVNMLNFLRTRQLFSTVAAPFCIANNNVSGIQFFHILVNTCKNHT